MTSSAVTAGNDYLPAYLYARHPSAMGRVPYKDGDAIELYVPSAKIAFGKGYMTHAEGLRNRYIEARGVEAGSPAHVVRVSSSLVTDAVAAVKEWTETQSRITWMLNFARLFLTASLLDSKHAKSNSAPQEASVPAYVYQIRASGTSVVDAEFCAGRDDLLEIYLPTIGRAVGKGYIHTADRPRNTYKGHFNGVEMATPLSVMSVPQSFVESVRQADKARITVQPRIDAVMQGSLRKPL